MPTDRTLLGSPRREALRWTLCFAAILGLHGAAALAMLTPPDDGDLSDISSAITVDYVVEGSNAPQRNVAAGPEQTQREYIAASVESKPLPDQDKPPKDMPPVEASEAHQRDSTEIKAAAQEPAATQPLPNIPDAEVALTNTTPPPPPPLVEKTTQPQDAVDVTTAPTQAAARAALATSWKRKVSARLQRFKHFPEELRGKRGMAQLQVNVDRNGNIVLAKIVQSSGYAGFDDEAIAMIRRAAPLPKPDRDVAESELSLSVPVLFNR